MEKEWKSPRKVKEELNTFIHQEFERTMVRVDNGEIPRSLAIAALNSEDFAMEWAMQQEQSGV